MSENRDFISMRRNDAGDAWLASVKNIGDGGWCPTPEAALIALMSVARELYMQIGSAPGPVNDADISAYLFMAAWFG